MTKPKLLSIGGALIDRRGQSGGPFISGVSNPGTMREEAGGAAFNTARTAARLGADVSMMTVRGGDNAGQAVAEAIASARIADCSTVHLDRATPSYTAILDERGELKAALADMALYETGFVKLARRSSTRASIRTADALMLDANLPEVAIGEIISHVGKQPVFANAISPAKAVRFGPHLKALGCLFMNAGEAGALTGNPKADASTLITELQALGLCSAVVSRGAKSILFFDEADAFSLQPPTVQIADVTGAGDALAGGTIAAILAGKPIAQAVRHGAAAAALVASSVEVSPDFSHDSFMEMLETVPEAEQLKF